jgi:alpha-galactosidase
MRSPHFGSSQLRTAILGTGEKRGAAMTADTKTPLEHVHDVLAQLKEMRHYAKNNVEALTAQWLLFDGELKKLKQAEPIETLMSRQSELHDALNEEIAALEELAVTLQPPPEEA